MILRLLVAFPSIGARLSESEKENPSPESVPWLTLSANPLNPRRRLPCMSYRAPPLVRRPGGV
jgi:hypothetical protein